MGGFSRLNVDSHKRTFKSIRTRSTATKIPLFVPMPDVLKTGMKMVDFTNESDIWW